MENMEKTIEQSLMEGKPRGAVEAENILKNVDSFSDDERGALTRAIESSVASERAALQAGFAKERENIQKEYEKKLEERFLKERSETNTQRVVQAVNMRFRDFNPGKNEEQSKKFNEFCSQRVLSADGIDTGKTYDDLIKEASSRGDVDATMSLIGKFMGEPTAGKNSFMQPAAGGNDVYSQPIVYEKRVDEAQLRKARESLSSLSNQYSSGGLSRENFRKGLEKLQPIVGDDVVEVFLQ